MTDGLTLQEPYAGFLRMIGITEPSAEDQLHLDLIDAVRDTWGQSTGAVLIAMRFRVVQHLRAAGTEYGEKRAGYQRLLDVETIRLMEGTPPVSKTEALLRVRASDEAYQLHLDYLVAEKREQWLRKLLDAFDSAMDLHRTDRADDRQVNRFGAAGHDGQA